VDPLTFASIPVIFENDQVIVLNKPQGLLTIEDGYHPELPNLKSILKNHFGQIWTVHRLDKETSGVILFAKNSESHKFLNTQFSLRLVKKVYQAIAHGHPFWSEKTINYPLKTNGDRRHRTVIDMKDGKQSKTLLRVIGKSDLLSYLNVFPSTGYTHQIRSHCAAIGHPILGDKLYFRGCMLDPFLEPDQLFLHASSLEISIKPNEEPQRYIATLPQCFIDIKKCFTSLP
jgi:RluA family pseudouridine synthase